jgi:hypothetical protein
MVGLPHRFLMPRHDIPLLHKGWGNHSDNDVIYIDTCFVGINRLAKGAIRQRDPSFYFVPLGGLHLRVCNNGQPSVAWLYEEQPVELHC